MKKQTLYNFSKLTGDYTSCTRQPSLDHRSRKNSQTKIQPTQYSSTIQTQQVTFNRIFNNSRPTGIMKVRKDEVSQSRSSVGSVSKESLRVTTKPYVTTKKVEDPEEFFRRFNTDNVVKYKTVSGMGKGKEKEVRRNIWNELDSAGKSNKRQSFESTFELPGLKINEFKSSLTLSSRHSCSKDSLQSAKSTTKLTMKQIEAKYKQSQQKIQKIRQKVNQLYRLNTESSEKDFKSLITRPKSRKGLQHRLLF